jgi:hypothetical protein
MRWVGFRNRLVLGALAAPLCACRVISGPTGSSCQFDPIDVSAKAPSGFARDDCKLSIVHSDAMVSYLFPAVVLNGPDGGSVTTEPDSGPAACSVELGPAPTSCKRDASEPSDVFLEFAGSAAASLLEALHVSASDDIILSLRLECAGAPTVNDSELLCTMGL